jgi:hypothetical protein
MQHNKLTPLLGRFAGQVASHFFHHNSWLIALNICQTGTWIGQQSSPNQLTKDTCNSRFSAMRELSARSLIME